MHRPDHRPADVVWFWFEKAFETTAYPQLSMLGSDWGMDSRPLSPEEYREAATRRMVSIYGEKP